MSPDGHPVAPPVRDPAVTFIEKFGRALHKYGLPSHRLEEALAAVADRLGLHSQFFATPTAIFASLERGGHEQTVLIRVDPGEVNLDKLSRLDELLVRVIAGGITPQAASRAVDLIVGARPTYAAPWVVFAFAVASASAARFFGGGWREILTCLAIGLFTGLVAVGTSHARSRFRAFEPVAAFIAGFCAAAATVVLPPISVYVATCAGLIALIPGLSLTTAINEIITRNLAAGTVRLAYSLLTFLQIGFGVAAGLKMGGWVFGTVPRVEPSGLDTWTLAVALALSALAFTILFQARIRDLGWIVLSSLIAFASARVAAHFGGMEAGAFAGALLVGIFSHAHGRILNRPISLTLVPGIILLVPGSIGFRSMSSLIAHDVVGGMELAFKMGMLGIALVIGLLVAGTIVPPRRSL